MATFYKYVVELDREAEVVRSHRWAGGRWGAARVWNPSPACQAVLGAAHSPQWGWQHRGDTEGPGSAPSMSRGSSAALLLSSSKGAEQDTALSCRLWGHLMRCRRSPQEPTLTIFTARLLLAPPVYKTQMLRWSSDVPQRPNLKSWSDRESVSSSGKLFHWLINYLSCSAPRTVFFLCRNTFGFQALELKMPLSSRLKSLLLLLSLWRHLLTTLESPLSLHRDRLNRLNICSSPHKGGLLASHSSCFCCRNPSNLFLSTFPAGCSRGSCSLSCLLPQLKSFWPSTEPCPALCRTGLSLSSAAAVSRGKLSPESLSGVCKKRGRAVWRGQSWAGFVCHGHRVFLPLTWHLPWLCKKRSPETGSCAGLGRRDGELGSLAVFRVCSHRSLPAPSECNCRDKVGAAWKSQGWQNILPRRKGPFRGPDPVSGCAVLLCDVWAVSHSAAS